MTLDATDLALVRELTRNGRATFAHLAETAGLSTSATQARVRRLESDGVITGYRAVVDADAVGRPLAAFVEITPLDPAQPDDAPARLEHLPEVTACYSVAGAASYLLLVHVAAPGALEDLLQRIRSAASVSTRSTVVLRTFFERGLDPQ